MRISRKAVHATCALSLVALAARADAQPSPTESAGFLGIILTPVGALPQEVRVYNAEDSASRFGADIRYANYRFQNSRLFHNFGLSGRFRVWPRLALAATVGTRTCSGCEGLRMASVDARFTMVHKAATEPGSGDTDLGVLLSGGIGRPNQARFNARTLALSLPFAITLPQPEHRLLTLHLSPSVAYGYINDGSGDVLGYPGGDGTTRFMVAAGVGYTLPVGLGVHAIVHRIIIEDSPTQLGFALSWAFGHR